MKGCLSQCLFFFDGNFQLLGSGRLSLTRSELYNRTAKPSDLFYRSYCCIIQSPLSMAFIIALCGFSNRVSLMDMRNSLRGPSDLQNWLQECRARAAESEANESSRSS